MQNIGKHCSACEQKDREIFRECMKWFPNMCQSFIWSQDKTIVDGLSLSPFTGQIFWELKRRTIDFTEFPSIMIEEGKVETAERLYNAGERLLYVNIYPDTIAIVDMSSIIGDSEYRNHLWSTNKWGPIKQPKDDGTVETKWGYRMYIPNEWATVIRRDTGEIGRRAKVRAPILFGGTGWDWDKPFNNETLEDYLCNSTRNSQSA